MNIIFNKEESRFEKYSNGLTSYLKQLEPKYSALLNIKKNYLKNPIVVTDCIDQDSFIALLPYILSSEKVLIVSPLPNSRKRLETLVGLHHVSESFVCQKGIVKEEDALLFLENGHSINIAHDFENIDRWNLVIASVSKTIEKEEMEQHLVNLRDQSEAFDLVIVTNAHLYPQTIWKLINNLYSGRKQVFLTRKSLNTTNFFTISAVPNKNLKITNFFTSSTSK